MTAVKFCRHVFRYAWSSGRGVGGRKVKLPGGKVVKSVALTLGFRCERCGESVERKATPGERKFYAREMDWARGRNIHAVWYEFARRFKTKNGFKYRSKGHDLMIDVEKWAKRHPKDVRIVGVDDSYFASSFMVLIEHKTTRSYMGTSVVVIPQCTGEDPLEFFLYPSHRKGLMETLRSIYAAAKPIKKLERKDERARDLAIRKNIQHPAVL
jgi:hypothetical protein